MKPAPFRYARARRLAEATAVLADSGSAPVVKPARAGGGRGGPAIDRHSGVRS